MTIEKPILFSGPMVRAILEGRKTVTRRVLKSQPHWENIPESAGWRLCTGCKTTKAATPFMEATVPTSYGATQILALTRVPCRVGDRLWVREAWRTDQCFDEMKPSELDRATPIRMEADGAWINPYDVQQDLEGRYRPPMFMPRWASRITLEVTGVTVERLQDITEEQAVAEGVIPHVRGGWHWHKHNPRDLDDWHQFGFTTLQFAYRDLWRRINAKRPGCTWDDNPWVAAISFRRLGI
jgi:hypothetical protein